jgi:hypothetical protein
MYIRSVTSKITTFLEKKFRITLVETDDQFINVTIITPNCSIRTTSLEELDSLINIIRSLEEYLSKKETEVK